MMKLMIQRNATAFVVAAVDIAGIVGERMMIMAEELIIL